jgi:two-component system, LuxR family, response regulator FixJ
MLRDVTNIVHVVDDDAALRDSLSVLFAARGITVIAYNGAEAFLLALPNIRHGCALIDVNMPGMSGIELLGRIRTAGSSIPCIVMTGFGEVSLAVKAMKAGASDFMEKPFENDILFETISHVLAEQSQSEPLLDARIARLTAREREVMLGIAQGRQNKVIANDLGISPRTVEIHRARVMTKLEASSVADVVKIALAAGL